MNKPVAIGTLKVDVYECNGRYPLDNGQPYTKKEIDEMFTLSYPKGTKFYRYREGSYHCWYLKNGDGGWTEWPQFFNKHPILSNLDIKYLRHK